MRSFDEISADVEAAIVRLDGAALGALADELKALGTEAARALEASARGVQKFYNNSLQEALDWLERALAIYRALGDRSGIARVTLNIGRVHRDMRSFSEALQLYEQALEIDTEIGNTVGVARDTNAIGFLYELTGSYAEAQTWNRKALALYEELGDRTQIARIGVGIGDVYRDTGFYPDALVWYEKSLAMHEAEGDLVRVAHVTSSIGLVYEETGSFAEAHEYQMRALALYEKLDDTAGIARVSVCIGNVHSSTNAYTEALEWYARALVLNESLGDLVGVILVYVNMGLAYVGAERLDEARSVLQQLDATEIPEPDMRCSRTFLRASIAEYDGDHDRARTLLLEALQESREYHMRAKEAEAHKALRDLAKKRKDLDGYVHHNDEYHRITEEITGRQVTQNLAMQQAEKRIAAERAEKEKHRALLYSTLPPAIADRVLRGETVNDSHDMAAVMFMDMVGFTTMSSAMEAGDVVSLLSQIFTTCDAIMAEHGMMKIKTIGDSYMAIAISNTEDQKPKTTQTVNRAVNNAANAAVKVLTTLTEQHPQIKVRIGLHCGPVTAGVIGTERLQYDVWGDTVNVASRMESTGEPGRIHVSEAFKESLTPCLPDSLTLIKRGLTDVKGKGPMTTYWLEGA